MTISLRARTDSAGNKIVPENEVEVLGLSATLTWDVGPGTLKAIVSTREMEAAFAQDNDMTPYTLVYMLFQSKAAIRTVWSFSTPLGWPMTG